ncbi:hypothetical protein Syun_031252 [Stephania yunnanensis]|uniref:Uncharacterized protein n=1 Tax=Stephania yunnanensis TaxID=152371 RepID=A0AAP0DX72_9MAGN
MLREEALGLLLVYSAVVVDNAKVESADDGVGLGAEEVVAIERVYEMQRERYMMRKRKAWQTMEVDANWVLGMEGRRWSMPWRGHSQHR